MSAPRLSAGVVLWDFDGTLAHRPGMWRAALLGALDAVAPGHGVTAEALRPGLRDAFPWHRPHLPHSEFTEADAWWAALHPVLARAYRAAGIARPVAEQATALVRDVYLDPAAWVVFEDAEPALARLAAAGWTHAVLSNHVPELPALVDALGLRRWIGPVLTSGLLGHEKPHRAAFAAALDALGRPGRVVMVGDDAEADVAGARAAGLPALLVRDVEGHGLSWAASRLLAMRV